MSEQATQTPVTYRLEVGDNAFWLFVWVIIACAVLALFALISHHNLRADEILAKTPSPLESACATSRPERVHPACMLLAKGEMR
jgi:hypothetical protein